MLFSVPSEPCSLEVISVTPRSVTIQWMSPQIPNGNITQYSLQCGDRIMNNFGWKRSNMLTGHFALLSPDTEYVLQLKAHTRVGPGPPAELPVKTCEY